MHYNSSPQSNVAPFVASRILAQLQQGKKVLWLLSGGSGAKVCIEVSRLLKDHDLSNLFATMSDERYGDIGHPNENIQQLLDGGFSLERATLYRPLNGTSVEDTTSLFSSWLTDIYHTVDYRIAVLGVGEDGHTCGIKPHSPAVTSTTAASHFVGEDFERITITATSLRRIDEGVVQAYGENKHAVIERFIEGRGELNDFPMLAIRDIPRVTIFSDYKEDK